MSNPTHSCPVEKAKLDRSTNCVKCKTERGKLVVRHAVYCRECFESLLLARFRKAFEPHINHVSSGTRRSALRPSGDLLLGLSGGVGSSVLLDVVHRTYVARTAVEEGLKGGREHPRKDKVWQAIRGAYVEVCGAFPGMADRTEKVRDAVARYEGIEFIPLRLEDAFDPVWWARIDQTPLADIFVDLSTDEVNVSPKISTSPSTPLDSLRDYLSRLPTSTAVLTAVAKLVRVLLLYTVRATRSSHLLLGTSLTSLSISLISSISQGAGFNVPQTIQEEWRPPGVSASDEKKRPWQGEVRVIRPLRDVGMKECAAWAWWNRLTVVGKERLPITAQTIGGLTKNFIVGLEKDFPSTVSTVSKTAAKLAPKGSAGDPCILCELPVQRGVQEWKARISIRTRSADGPLAASTAAPSVALAPPFCYACHTMLISRSSRGTVPTKGSSTPAPPPIVPLPVWSAAALSRSRSGGRAEVYTEQAGDDGRVNDEVWQTRKLSERDMRAAVGDFLLDE